MNEDVITFLKSKNNINKAKENLEKRIKKEDAVKENLKTRIKKEEEEKIAAEKEEQERKKRYENYIIEAKNNNQIIINTIIKELVEEYMEMANRYNNTINDDYEISIEYNLDWLEQYCHKIEKYHKYPYIYGEAYRCYESYNEKQEDDTKTVYYFLTNIEDSYYEYSWEPVIFDIEKMKSYNLFSDIILEDKKLRIKVKYSAIRELIKKAGNKELEDVFDKSLLNFLKAANETIIDEQERTKNFREKLIRNTGILYNNIYEKLKAEMAKGEIKDEYVIPIMTKCFLNKDIPEINLYKKHLAKRYEEIKYCGIKINDKKIYLLIELGILADMLARDKEYGYLKIENKNGLKIKFDGKVFDSFIASLEDNEPAEEIDKGQAITLHRKDGSLSNSVGRQ